MTKRPHSELIKAWADGAQIQRFVRGEWIDEIAPSWYEVDQYRIKPGIGYIRYRVARFEEQGQRMLAVTERAHVADEWEKYGNFHSWLTDWTTVEVNQ